MLKISSDGLTEYIGNQRSEFEQTVYDMEDQIIGVEKGSDEIIRFLKSIDFYMPLGKMLRRYLCAKFSTSFDENTEEYVFNLTGDKEMRVRDYRRNGYDIESENIDEFTELFLRINKKYNTNSNGELLLDFPKSEARRMLKSETCQREKLFLISFALHFDSEDTHKFLTDVLAEQTYNFRNPNEIIACYCQSDEINNSYATYCRLLFEYESQKSAEHQVADKMQQGYTNYATAAMGKNISNDEELIAFLVENQANFEGYSQTAYDEFIMLLNQAKSLTKSQGLANDEYIFESDAHTVEQFNERNTRLNNAVELRPVMNNEQLAQEMLRCIPRYTRHYVRELRENGVKTGETLKVVENEFININNGERGQKSARTQTTTLPRQITRNLLMASRLNALEKRKKSVERKDLVFLKFYVFSKEIENKGSYTAKDYQTFIDECNDMLNNCGMSNLYPANRFENLILLSLLADNPFEMFENIMEYSFFNEPQAE